MRRALVFSLLLSSGLGLQIAQAQVAAQVSAQVSAPVSGESAAEIDALRSIKFYQRHYGLKDVYAKKVDEEGHGYKHLYGVRNFRAVLNGVVFRGGANNRYHRKFKRDNENPLPVDGLVNLCEEGFGRAIYLYSTRFESAPQSVQCTARNGSANEITYTSIEPLKGDTEVRQILQIVYASLVGTDHRPIYLHCWNGWHASGFISALSLRQFCGWTGNQAVEYWKKNTDGNDAGHREILRKIHHFKVDSAMLLPERVREIVCPTPPEEKTVELIPRDLTH